MLRAAAVHIYIYIYRDIYIYIYAYTHIYTFLYRPIVLLSYRTGLFGSALSSTAPERKQRRNNMHAAAEGMYRC